MTDKERDWRLVTSRTPPASRGLHPAPHRAQGRQGRPAGRATAAGSGNDRGGLGIDFEPMYTTKDVCKIFQISRLTLWRWRKERAGFPKPVKINERVLRYRKADIEAFKKNAGQ